MTNVSPLLRRLLAVTLLVAMAWLAWSGVVAPLREDFASHAVAVERDAEFLVRYRAHAATRPELDGELARLRAIETARGGFLKADNPALAAAALQDRLKLAITKAGGTLKSVQVLAPEADGNYRRVAVDVMVSAGIGALEDLLYDLETGVPYLFVDELEVRRTGARIPAGKADAGEDPVQARFMVSGFMRGGDVT